MKSKHSKTLIFIIISFILLSCKKNDSVSSLTPSLSLSQTLLKYPNKTWVYSDSALNYTDLEVKTVRFVNGSSFIMNTTLSQEVDYIKSTATWSASNDDSKLTLSWVDTFLTGMGPRGQMPQSITYHISHYDSTRLTISGVDSAGTKFNDFTNFGTQIYFY